MLWERMRSIKRYKDDPLNCYCFLDFLIKNFDWLNFTFTNVCSSVSMAVIAVGHFVDASYLVYLFIYFILIFGEYSRYEKLFLKAQFE